MLPMHCQFTKRFEILPKTFLAFENYELQNCRRHHCQHNFAEAQTVLVSFQRKKAHYFEKK